MAEGTKKLIVEIVGRADEFAGALDKAKADTAGFAASMASVGSKVTSVGKTLTKSLTLPLVAASAVSVKFASDFQSSMELVHTQAGASEGEVKKLSQAVLELAPKVGTGPDKLAEGLFHLESQGLRGAKAMDALKTAAEGAKVGQANLEDVTNALGAVMVSNIKGAGNLNQVMGELNATVGAGDMRMQDLADAMGTGLAANAKVVGVSLRDVSAALAVFGDNNIRGAKAGTLLGSALRIMSAGSKAADKELGKIGLSTLQLGNVMRTQGLVPALELLQKKLKASGMTAGEQAQVISRAFGGRQSTGIKILLEQLERLKTKVKEVGEGGDKFAQDWTATTQTSKFGFDQLKASMEALAVSFGSLLLPIVQTVVGWFSQLANWLSSLSPTTQKWIEIIAGGAAAIGPVVAIIGTLVTAIGGLAAAFTFLAANPIVLAVAGLAAFAAAVAAAVLAPDKLKAALERMGLSAQTSGEVVKTLQGVFQNLKTVVSDVANWIRQNWSTIQTVFTTAVGVVRTAIANMIAVIKPIVEIIRGVVNIIKGIMTGNFSQIWTGVKQVVAGAVGSIIAQFRMLVGGVLSQLASLAGRALSAAAKIGKQIVSGIVSGLKGLVSAVTNAFSVLWAVISNLASAAYGAAINIGLELIQGIVDGVKSAIGWAAGEVAGAAKSIWHAAGSILHGSGDWHFTEAFGSEMAKALIQGFLAQLPKSNNMIANAVRQATAVAMAADVLSAMREAGRVIGIEHAKAIVMGFLQQQPSLGQQMKTALRQAVQQSIAAAAQAVTDARSAFTQAFDSLASAALSAFDAEMAKWQSPAAKLLAKLNIGDLTKQITDALGYGIGEMFATMEAQFAAGSVQAAAALGNQLVAALSQQLDSISAQLESANAALASAQAELDAAKASGDQGAIDAAQKKVDAANAQITALQNQKQAIIAALQEIDKIEQAAKDQKNEKDKLQFQKELTALENAFAMKKISYETFHKKLMALLEKWVPDYVKKGAAQALALAQGLRSEIGKVEAAAQALRDAILKKLNVTAVVTVEVDTSGTMGAKALGGPVARGMPYLVGERGPEVFIPSAAGRIVPNNQLPQQIASGAVGESQLIQLMLDRRILAEVVRDELGRIKHRNFAGTF